MACAGCTRRVPLAHPQGDGAAALVGSVDDTARSPEALQRGEGERYRELLGPLAASARTLLDLGLGPWPPLRALARSALQLGPADAWRTLRTGSGPAASAPLGRHGMAFLAGCGLHADLGPDRSEEHTSELQSH